MNHGSTLNHSAPPVGKGEKAGGLVGHFTESKAEGLVGHFTESKAGGLVGHFTQSKAGGLVGHFTKYRRLGGTPHRIESSKVLDSNDPEL